MRSCDAIGKLATDPSLGEAPNSLTPTLLEVLENQEIGNERNKEYTDLCKKI